MMTMIRIGSRGSKLARWQAEWVSAELAKQGVETEIVLLKTLGDTQAGPIEQVGVQGVFTKEIQRALLDRRVDLAVHSLKDLPTADTPGLLLAAVPAREPCGDALISSSGQGLNELPPHAVIATGSTRRRAQLLAHRSDLTIRDVRGNVDTRLAKLSGDDLDAIVLAEAGLRRLDLADRITQVLPKSVMLPAPGQGALGLEVRASDAQTRSMVARLDHELTHCAVTAERAMLESLRGGCLAPVGAWARFEQDELVLDAIVLDTNGTKKLRHSARGTRSQARQLGIDTAESLIGRGAKQLLDAARQTSQ